MTARPGPTTETSPRTASCPPTSFAPRESRRRRPSAAVVKADPGPKLAAAVGAGPSARRKDAGRRRRPTCLRLQLDQRGAAVETAYLDPVRSRARPRGRRWCTRRDRLHADPRRTPGPTPPARSRSSSPTPARPPGHCRDRRRRQRRRAPRRRAGWPPRSSIRTWEVVRGRPTAGPPSATLSRVDPAAKAKVEGQEIAFRDLDPRRCPAWSPPRSTGSGRARTASRST